jgi:hypothetical protein
VQDERDPGLTPVERILAKRREAEDAGIRLSERAMQSQRSLEGYLQAGNRPRWMERLAEIEHGITSARRLLERAYRDLQAEYATDREAFARRWHELAPTWSFDEVNERIRQHNEWFPIERQLAIDPRTRDYVLINGRSYRRPELGPQWVLDQFPADPDRVIEDPSRRG